MVIPHLHVRTRGRRRFTTSAANQPTWA